MDPVAQQIVDAALAVRRSHPTVPALDVLDLAMQGQRGTDPDFDGPAGDATVPPAPFALLLRDAFDPGFPEAELATRQGWASQGAADRWEAVLDRFAQRYQIWVP